MNRNRKSPRLKTWDYRNPWWYFITICTDQHINYFGDIKNANVTLNNLGKITKSYLLDIPNHFNFTEINYYVIMPNHLHFILILNENENSPNHRDVIYNIPTSKYSQISPIKGSISSIIRSYKASVTRWAKQNKYTNFKWQSSFYDRIIRNENELYQIRRYIELNPLKFDLENSENISI